MTTKNEILYNNVSSKLKAIHQTNKDLSIPCIYKVSKELRKLNKSAYNPCVVSIGPIHNKNDDDVDKEEQHLKEMEHIKVVYTKELLCRIAGTSASPEDERHWKDALMKCSTAMLDSEARALNCYAENLKPIIEKKIHQHRLAEMLLIDGCFILELLYRSYLNIGKSISQGEPILGNSMIMSDIRHDLLLLENQLPFFILKELFSKTIKNIRDHPWSSCPSLTQFVLSFFGNMMNVKMIVKNDDIQSTTINPENDNCFHILHLLHSFYLSKPHNSESEPPENDNCCHILHLLPSFCLSKPPDDDSGLPHYSHRASDLNRAGVKFKRRDGKGQFDVNFEEASGLLWWCDSAKFEIPPLSIDDFTEPLLRNLIAFEQCCYDIKGRHYSSYAFLMDSLINSAADIELLEEAGIITNNLGASEEASVLFNNICKYIELEKFDFLKPRNDAENHCKRLWPKFLTSLKRDYFYNPWSVIAVVAAFILFALAVVQTVYALLTYYGVEYETVRELHDMHSVL
ncbi:hypothetical protein HYC85_022541 [Camellia sinensis]|uniref:Uncharacterized protein n=1 Tax=Camellia sinensis TaxID=4442 RepID=A0A7J7GPP2_CAMSI|nr:hypothetical protein HYC85_022541 [Camellia sinensis]